MFISKNKMFIFQLFIVLSIILCGYSQAFTLVSEWQLDEGSGSIINDSSRNFSTTGSKGILSGTANWGVDYFSFNGASHFKINRKSNNFFVDMSKSFYISATIRTSAQNGCIIGRSNSIWVPFAKVFGLYQGKLYFSCGWNGELLDDVNINDGQWHSVGVDFNQSTGIVKLYLDGQTAATSSAGAFSSMAGANDKFDLFIGVQCIDSGSWYNHFTGDIKDVLINNFELNAFGPVPGNGTAAWTNPTTNQISWSTPDQSAVYNVYFSTEQELVEKGDSTVLRSSEQADETYGISLENGRRYFWRIDTKIGSTIYPGRVWTFVSCNQVGSGSSTYYVATNGSDLNSGTSTGSPFATIQKARDKIGCDIMAGATENKTVYIRGGEYYLDSGIIFDSWSSGKGTQTITFQNYSGEKPIVIGGKQITGWTLDSGNVYKSNVGSNRKFSCLFENNKRSIMAREPDTDYYRIATGNISPTEFGYSNGQFSSLADYSDAQVVVWAGGGDWNWSNITQPITNFNSGTRRITIAQGTQWNLPTDNRYFVQGARELLTMPGEFHLNTSTGWLYYWPVNTPVTSQKIVAPTTQNIVKICGTSDLEVAGNLIFEGIEFTISDFAESYFINSINEEEEIHQGLIQLENAENVTIRNSKVKNAGFAGIMLDKYSQDNLVYNNQITDIGYHGVYLSGWNLGESGWDIGEGGFITPSDSYVNKNNIVRSNFISGCGKLCGHGSGVYVYQSGNNEISNNTIRFNSSRGIAVQGTLFEYCDGYIYYYTVVNSDNYYSFIHSRDNNIKFNDISKCFYDVQDVGLFYTQAAGQNNILNNNIFHDSYVSISGGYGHGIYIDDGAGYWTVQNNIIYGIASNGGNGNPLFCKGSHNTLTNNILVDNDYSALSGNLGNVCFWAMGGVPNDYLTVTKNIFYQYGGQWIYYFMDDIGANRISLFGNNTFFHPYGADNIHTASGTITFNNWGYDQNSITSDPLFTDRFRHNYNVVSGSNSLDLGFSNIDVSNVGLDSNYPFLESQLYPAARFMLDEQSGTTAYDSSINGNDGTVNGTVTWIGDGLKLNESTYVEIANRNYYACNVPFTWSAWVKTGLASTGVIIARSNLSSWSTGAKELYVDSSGRLSFGVGWVGTVVSQTKINDNQWHHVAVSYNDADCIKLYVDGKVVATGTLDLNNATDTNFTMHIGLQNTGSYYFNGVINKVEFYNAALSDSDLENLYFDSYIPAVPSPAGFWALNETSGSIAYDSSGGNNRGIINETISWADNALYFNGSSTYVDIADHAGYECDVPFTWSAWIKTSGTSDVIIARDQLSSWTPGAKELYIDSNGKLAFSTGWVGTVSSNATVNDNQWHHVAATYNGTYVQLYKDGTPTISGAMSLSGVTDTDFTMKLGIQNTSVGLFTGYMRKVCLFDYSLTPAEIKSLYYDYLTSPLQASAPNPSNDATQVIASPTMSWTAGTGAIWHGVYLGTNQSNVINATPASAEYKGIQSGVTYNAGSLNPATTYYWRIDEVAIPAVRTGTTWSFTTSSSPPSFVAAGAIASNAAAITPALPAGINTNDILLLFLETANQAISIANQNGGTWTQVTNSPQGTGTAGGTTASRLTIYWSRYNGTQGAPTTSDSGNHQIGRMIAIRGAATSGNPWDVTAGGVESTSDSSGSIPGATTTVGNTLIVAAVVASLPDAIGTTNFSNWTNANLTNLTEQIDNTHDAGNGGALGIITGVKASAGAYGNTTVTHGVSAIKGMLSIAIQP